MTLCRPTQPFAFPLPSLPQSPWPPREPGIADRIEPLVSLPSPAPAPILSSRERWLVQHGLPITPIPVPTRPVYPADHPRLAELRDLLAKDATRRKRQDEYQAPPRPYYPADHPRLAELRQKIAGPIILQRTKGPR